MESYKIKEKLIQNEDLLIDVLEKYGFCHIKKIKQDEIRCFGKTKTKRFKTIEEAIVQRLLWEWMYYGENAPQKHLFKKYLFNIY